MNFSAQKAALTRAVKSKDPEAVIATARKTVQEWDANGPWPDAWHRWDIALSDAFGWAYTAYVKGSAPKPDSSRFVLETLRRA